MSSYKLFLDVNVISKRINPFVVICALFLLSACHGPVDLNDNYSIRYSDVTHSYGLYYKSEGIINSDVSAYFNTDEYIVTKSDHSGTIYLIHKKKFAKAYGKGNSSEAIRTFNYEFEARKALSRESEIEWIMLD